MPQQMSCTSLLSSSNVLTVQDTECFLKRLDLFLPPCHAVFVADSSVNAARLKLLVVGEGRIKLLLGSIKIGLLLLKGLLLVLLLPRLVLDVLCLLGLVHRRIAHELVILLLCLRFCSTGLRLEARKVRLDHLDHANHATVLCTHALVGFVKDLRLLHKGGGLRSLGVKLLQNAELLRHCGLRILGILDRDSVLCFLLFADTCCLCDSRIELRHSLGQFSDLLGELCDRSLELIDLCVKGLH